MNCESGSIRSESGIRGDKGLTGGIIHVPMFARILLGEYILSISPFFTSAIF